MDDERIRQLTEEVLGAVREAPAERERETSLEARLGALETAVRRLETGSPKVMAAAMVAAAPPPARAHAHPSLRLLDVPGGDDRCILEPDKPCEKSGRCRTFGF